MPYYIILGNYTQKGIDEIKQTEEKLKGVHELAKENHGEVKQLFYTFGRYDVVAFVEFPDNAALMNAVIGIARTGEVRTETLVAMPVEEYVAITKEFK